MGCVSLPKAKMPVAVTDAKRQTEPIPGYGFAVEIAGTIAGWFTECSGLVIEREVKEHPEGGVNDFVHKLPGRIKRSNITLKHGLAGNELWEWFQKGSINGLIERQNVSVVLYNTDLSEAKRWDLVDVYPAKWSGPSFKSDNKEVIVETLELAHVQSSNKSSTIQRSPLEPEGQPPAPTNPDVDIKALAQKVYDLLREVARVERERLGHR